ncbi:hypothetical protein NHP190003_16220 (plasmid) [Helicobacter sp. NHP19-003]|uniref:Addiction module killer protein n=1 Tax=Helicobacter gastrocanis TaxID=2849641 RepID=A0ABM7SEV1_9HELI|nr:type II toxin-antitoxin system RelE/ParE family toxin [Helicobacter sp. NHP19-003]BCZ18340.1 hypothetical protein NHP190003_16220 [Helicobacter sp. NHP19-003]
MEIQTSKVFKKWLNKLRDEIARAKISYRIKRLKDGDLGDYKHIQETIFELRIHTGPGYRLYISKQGAKLVILLCGGDKSTQQRDIIKAQKILEQEF